MHKNGPNTLSNLNDLSNQIGAWRGAERPSRCVCAASSRPRAGLEFPLHLAELDAHDAHLPFLRQHRVLPALQQLLLDVRLLPPRARGRAAELRARSVLSSASSSAARPQWMNPCCCRPERWPLLRGLSLLTGCRARRCGR